MRNVFRRLQRDPSVDSTPLLNMVTAGKNKKSAIGTKRSGWRVGCKRALNVRCSCVAASAFNPCGRGSSSSARLRSHARLRLFHRMSAQTSQPGDLVSPIPDPLFSVAPMMDVTDRHFRYLFRHFSRRSVLWTEMVASNALFHKPELAKPYLEFHPCERPLVLQLGGNQPEYIRRAAEMAQSFGYNEVNLNCGCPSEKVSGKGCFGAALMLEPKLVAEIMSAFNAGAGGIDASVKCRIGVDDMDSYEYLRDFVGTVAEHGNVKHFVVHARKALLGASFSPEDNRRVPPLRHDRVLRLIEDFPELRFTINGGFTTYEEVNAALDSGVAGVMVGRAAMNRPFYWSRVDELIYGESPSMEDRSRKATLAAYGEYAEERLAEVAGTQFEQKRRRFLARALENVFSGEKGGKQFRGTLNEEIRNKDLSFTAIMEKALSKVDPDVLVMQPEDLDLSKIESNFEGSSKKIYAPRPAPASGKRGSDPKHMHAIDRSIVESKVIVPSNSASKEVAAAMHVTREPAEAVRVKKLSLRGLLKQLQALGSKMSGKGTQLMQKLKPKKGEERANIQSNQTQKVRFRSSLSNDTGRQLNDFGQKISEKKAERIERLKRNEREQKLREDQHRLPVAEGVPSQDLSDLESAKVADSPMPQ